ncbi:MAG TPA: cobalamin biosynthesis protein, partial [Noviherbaspirillum sp.]|nr:cobalamin biosynthesis protein [Noviherbaspirillum sp.]
MLSGLGLEWMAALLVAGVAIDLLLGEPRRWHPLVGFGNVAAWIERRLNRAPAGDAGPLAFRTLKTRLTGFAAWALCVIPFVALAAIAIEAAGPPASLVMHLLLLYACLGLR